MELDNKDIDIVNKVEEEKEDVSHYIKEEVDESKRSPLFGIDRYGNVDWVYRLDGYDRRTPKEMFKDNLIKLIFALFSIIIFIYVHYKSQYRSSSHSNSKIEM